MMFLVVLDRAGPRWDPSSPLEDQTDWAAHASFMDELVESGFVILGGPLADEQRVVLAVDASSEDEVRETLALDPWSETHLRVRTIDPWAIRLDGRHISPRPANRSQSRETWSVSEVTKAGTRARHPTPGTHP